MLKEIDNSIVQQLIENAVETAWIQWKSIGTFIESDRIAASMVDPEALLFVSLALCHHERRFWDILASWARSGSKLFSVQRVKNMLKKYPETTKDRLSEFAYMAKTAGSDFRWGNLVGPETGPIERKPLLWEEYPSVWERSALLLRLRLAFGIGIVPDLLGFLLSLRGEWASARLIAKAINFSVYSIRRTADNMVASGLIESTQEKPVEYRVKTETWCKLLGIDGEIPSWRFWYQVYPLVIDIINLTDDEAVSKLSPYLFSSRIRDIMEVHEDAFVLNRIDVPDPKRFPGEQYIEAFNNTILTVNKWIRDSV